MDIQNTDFIRAALMIILGGIGPIFYLILSLLSLKRTATWVSWLLIITSSLRLVLAFAFISTHPILSSINGLSIEEYSKLLIPLQGAKYILDIMFMVAFAGLVLTKRKNLDVLQLRETFS